MKKALLIIVLLFLIVVISFSFNEKEKQMVIANHMLFGNSYETIEFNKNDIEEEKDNVINSEYEPIYYRQKDFKWMNRDYGGYKFGRTGCAPTVMAMAFSGILNKEILPTDVADYLYYHTDEYNKINPGSSGKAIILAANYYNIKYKPLINKSDLENALKLGKLVFAAMGEGHFGTKEYNHAILVYGYDNEYAYVLDPSNFIVGGWIPIEQLIKEQSKDPDDSSGGSNFYSLEKY